MVVIDGKYGISAPLFLMFAEYLGFAGKTMEWADNLCFKKNKPEDWQMKFMQTEAKVILDEAKKKYGEEKMKQLFEELYDVILEQYENNIYATIQS